MMPAVKSVGIICGIVQLAFFVSGCSQSSWVKVSRHGGTSLDSSMVVTVGGISGDQDKEYRNELIKALTESGDINMLREGLGRGPMTNPELAVIVRKLGQKKQTLVLITGSYKLTTDDSHKEKQVGDTKKSYIEKTFTGRFAFNLFNLSNNTIFFSRELQASLSEEKDDSWLLNALVDAIVTDPLNEQVRKKVIESFLYELHPHEEVYEAQLYKDSDMPELETGITHASIGHWDKAIELFKSVTDKYPNHQNIHKAYYDLGIAYKWNFMFPEARENLEKAYLLKNNSEYFDEIQSLSQFEEEYNLRQKGMSPIE